MTRDHRRGLEAHGGVIVARYCAECRRSIPIEAVSRALRHGSTRSTEAYYARMSGEDAFREIERAFERPVVKVEPE